MKEDEDINMRGSLRESIWEGWGKWIKGGRRNAENVWSKIVKQEVSEEKEE